MNTLHRRLLALLLALAFFLFPAALPAVAAFPETDAAVQTVRALGIMTGDEQGRMNLNDNVTRAQFAKMMAAASTYKDSVSPDGAGYSLYSDVKSGHWASEYIRLAAREGWMTGYTDGSFHPESGITLEEGCTALLRLLGYDSASLGGSFPQAQLSKAAALGLRDDLARRQGEPLLRSDCVTLFYNLLTCQTAAGQTYAASLGYSLLNGTVDYIAVLRGNLSGPRIAAGGDTLPFSPLTVYRDGKPSASAALNPNDVYYWHEGLRTVWIYTERVSGKVEAVAAAGGAPTSLTLDGTNYSISGTEAAYRLSALTGDPVGTYVTLLLGMDGDVVGLLTGDAVNAVSYGVLQSAVRELAPEGQAVLGMAYTVLGTDGVSRIYHGAVQSPSIPTGSVVKVAVSTGGVTVTGEPDLVLTGTVDVRAGGFRDMAFAEQIQILDVGDDGAGKTVPVQRLAGVRLDRGALRYYTLDAAGRIDRLILRNVTGDTWTYALLLSALPASMELADTAYTYLSNGNTATWQSSNVGYPVEPGGIAIHYGQGGTVQSIRQLGSLELDSVADGLAVGEGTSRPVAEDVQVYYYQGGNYYQTELSAVPPESYALTGWYDDLGFPAGGQIRLVLAERRNG